MYQSSIPVIGGDKHATHVIVIPKSNKAHHKDGMVFLSI